MKCQERGLAEMRVVIAEMQRLSALRYAEAKAVFDGLPRNISFEDALTIKAARGDPCALGWERQSDGTCAKPARRGRVN